MLVFCLAVSASPAGLDGLLHARVQHFQNTHTTTHVQLGVHQDRRQLVGVHVLEERGGVEILPEDEHEGDGGDEGAKPNGKGDLSYLNGQMWCTMKTCQKAMR